MTRATPSACPATDVGLSFGSVLRRGVLAGVSAGLSAALVSLVVVEPVIRRALAVEDARSLHGGQSAPSGLRAHGGEEPLVSRAAQVVGGAVTAGVRGLPPRRGLPLPVFPFRRPPPRPWGLRGPVGPGRFWLPGR